MIKIQKKDFNIDDEIDLIKSKHLNVGAISTFVGYVKNLNNQKKVKFINLEVYKEMAYKTLENTSSIVLKKATCIPMFSICYKIQTLANETFYV